MASTINKKLRRKRAEKISELIKQEEQGSELYCSKYGKDLECDNKTILIDPPNINDNNVSVCKENIYIYIYMYVQIGLNMLNQKHLTHSMMTTWSLKGIHQEFKRYSFN